MPGAKLHACITWNRKPAKRAKLQFCQQNENISHAFRGQKSPLLSWSDFTTDRQPELFTSFCSICWYYYRVDSECFLICRPTVKLKNPNMNVSNPFAILRWKCKVVLSLKVQSCTAVVLSTTFMTTLCRYQLSVFNKSLRLNISIWNYITFVLERTIKSVLSKSMAYKQQCICVTLIFSWGGGRPCINDSVLSCLTLKDRFYFTTM